MIAKQLVPTHSSTAAGFSAAVFNPQTFEEAMTLAKFISSSAFCPKSMVGKPADVLLALQLGAEVALSPMQALQNIAVIGGRPCVWGDAALAIVQAHHGYMSHREWWEGSIKDGTRTAYCAITRKNAAEHIVSFSMEDAKKAKLWTKQGAWSEYPDRMLQMRARGFCIRDKFADALKGLITREEAQDYPNIVAEVKPAPMYETGVTLLGQAEPYKADITKMEENTRDACLVDDLNDIGKTDSLAELEKVFKAKYAFYVKKKDKEALQQIIKMKDERKSSIQKTIDDWKKELTDNPQSEEIYK